METSPFKDVASSDPYKEYGLEIVKLECIGHVQKRPGPQRY